MDYIICFCILPPKLFMWRRKKRFSEPNLSEEKAKKTLFALWPLPFSLLATPVSNNKLPLWDRETLPLLGSLQFAYHLRANNKQGTFSSDRKTASDVKLLFAHHLRVKAEALYINLLGAISRFASSLFVRRGYSIFAPLLILFLYAEMSRILFIVFISKIPPSSDWEARHGRSVTQHQGPLGDRPNQLEVHPEAWPRPVWGGLGGFVEQHDACRHQNTQDRCNQ